jgi:hypothetical protein
MAELLFWPALIAYGEAAVAYAGELRGPGCPAGWRLGRADRLARADRAPRRAAARRGRLPVGHVGRALNLFVWLVVGAYLIWGCRPRYRLLGLAVMPLPRCCSLAAWAGGGTGVEDGDRAGCCSRPRGLMLAGFAALTLAPGWPACTSGRSAG